MPDTLIGRDLDAAVAERVMGFRWFRRKRDGLVILCLPKSDLLPIPPMITWEMVDSTPPVPPIAERFDDWDREVPLYSSDLGQAWKVVEEMHRRGFHYRLQGWFTNEQQKHWAYFDERGWADTHPLYSAEGDTPAEAICRAALKCLKEK